MLDFFFFLDGKAGTFLLGCVMDKSVLYICKP